MNPKTDWFFEKAGAWQKEFLALRSLLSGFPLAEELKWGKPCYTLGDQNVAILGGFKEYCALMFFKGALMADPAGVLVAPGKVQAGRQLRFTSAEQIAEKEPLIRAYLAEAIKIEKSGQKVTLKAHSEYEIPPELETLLNAKPRLNKAFNALTPGRQRGYMLFIAAPKQAKTREARAEKCIPAILAGKGLND